MLVHCFAGCGAADVIAAVGLDMADLFPPREGQRVPSATWRRVPRLPAQDALLLLDGEAWFVEVAARRLAAGEIITNDCRGELGLAASRISVVRLAWMAAS